MREVVLFTEDLAHDAFLKPLISRLASIHAIPVAIQPRSTRGGHSMVIRALRRYLRELRTGQSSPPDLLVIATDANCRTHQGRRREIEAETEDFRDSVVCAIPDPHIERWLLLDSAAFKAVLGKGCSPPDRKCERRRYKRVLIEAVRDAGVTPLLGGIEHAEEIIQAMDLHRMEQADESLGKLLRDLNARFREWTQLRSV